MNAEDIFEMIGDAPFLWVHHGGRNTGKTELLANVALVALEAGWDVQTAGRTDPLRIRRCMSLREPAWERKWGGRFNSSLRVRDASLLVADDITLTDELAMETLSKEVPLFATTSDPHMFSARRSAKVCTRGSINKTGETMRVVFEDHPEFDSMVWGIERKPGGDLRRGSGGGPCETCGGSGEIELLTSRVACEDCGGVP